MYHVESSPNVKLSNKPWITKPILAKIRYRDKLYSKIIRGKHSNSNLIYLHKKFRNSVVKDVKANKSDYFKNYFLYKKNNMKKIWSGIRSIINISKVKADYIPSILESGKTVDNPCAIANIFNNFFVNVGKNGRLEKPETGIRNRNGNGNGNRNGNRKRQRHRNRNSNVKGNQYKNRDIIYFKLFLFLFNLYNNKKQNKKTSLVSCSPPNLFILQQRESRKSRKQQLCECIALSVNFFTAYAQLRRK